MIRIIAILLLTCNLAVAQISQQTIVNEITANLPTNNQNEISAELLRNTLNQMTSAIFQSQGLSGLTITNTAVIGEALIATGTTTASWQNIGGLITSVSNNDGSLNVSPTTGNVIASLNTNHVNTWTQLQTYTAGVNIGGASVGTLSFPFTGANNIVSIGGGANVGGFPHLLFQPSTSIPAPNTILVGFGTNNAWPFSYNDYQGADVSIVDPYGTGTLSLAMRTSDRRSGSANPVNLIMTTVHDNPSAGTPASNVWGMFHIAWKTAAAYGSGAIFQAYEQSVLNLGTAVSGDPYNVNPADAMFGWRIDSGDGPTATGIYDPSLVNPSTNAIDIVSNGTTGTISGGTVSGQTGTFYAGIRIGAGAIAPLSGHTSAIQLACGNEIDWYTGTAYNVAGTLTGEITTNCSGNTMLLSSTGGTRITTNGSAQFDCGITFGAFCTVTSSSGLAVNSNVTNSNASGYQLTGGTSTTLPLLLPNRSNANAGIGANAAGNVSIFANNAGSAVEVMRATGTGPAFETIPTSAGVGGLFICIDTSGVIYKKATCP